MPSTLRTAVLALPLLAFDAGALAESSAADRCGWARPSSLVSPAPNRPKFALNVALRPFSFPRTFTDRIEPRAEPVALNPELHQSETFSPRPRPLESLRLLPRYTGLPQLLSWMRGWRLEKDRGLFRPLRFGSRLAFTYSDVFETGGDAEKGGHGLGLILRHDLGPASRRIN